MLRARHQCDLSLKKYIECLSESLALLIFTNLIAQHITIGGVNKNVVKCAVRVNAFVITIVLSG